MFKRITMIAAVAALAVVMTPAASQAGGVHKREARTACPITKLLHREIKVLRNIGKQTAVTAISRTRENRATVAK